MALFSFLRFATAPFSSFFSANYTLTKIAFHFIIVSLKSAKELTIKMSEEPKRKPFDLEKLQDKQHTQFLYLFHNWAVCMTEPSWLDKLVNMGELHIYSFIF